MAPNTFEDVAALIALYRPGPMGANMHYDYADRKNGRKPVEYFHADAEEVLGDTYGLMIYQESVMRVAQKFAGYSLAEADNLRKACGKKIREMMAKERDSFEAGCERTGYGELLGKTAVRHHRAVRRLRVQQEPHVRLRAGHVPDGVPEGALSGRVLRLPAHQREEQPRQGGGRTSSDCRSMGIKVLTPDVNRSVTNFAALPAEQVPADIALPVGSPGAITFGLSAVRNVGEGLVELLVAERDENGVFTSFHDFAERVPEPVLNKRTVESLIKGGAFDSLGHPRRGPARRCSSRSSTPPSSRRRERDQGVMSLFGDWGDGDAASATMRRRRVRRADGDPRARVRQGRPARYEKEMLGLYVSDHPLFGVEARSGARSSNS